MIKVRVQRLTNLEDRVEFGWLYCVFPSALERVKHKTEICCTLLGEHFLRCSELRHAKRSEMVSTVWPSHRTKNHTVPCRKSELECFLYLLGVGGFPGTDKNC